MMGSVVVRFFKRNDRGWKNLWYRQVREGSVEDALAWAFHVVRKSPPELKAQILSIEVENKNGAAAATVAQLPETASARAGRRR